MWAAGEMFALAVIALPLWMAPPHQLVRSPTLDFGAVLFLLVGMSGVFGADLKCPP